MVDDTMAPAMKVLFLTSGARVPTTRFRVLQYVPYLRALGHRCTVAHSHPQKYDYWPAMGWRPSQWFKRGVRVWHLFRGWIGAYDVIFVERELFNDGTWSMEERFRRIARAMVLDVDDAVFLEHPGKLERIVSMCDVVIAGNRFLKDRIAPHAPNVEVIPTCVDLARYAPKVASPGGRRVVIGWMGTASNLNNLSVVAPALRSLASRCDFEFQVVTGEDAPLDSLDLGGIPTRFLRWDAGREVEQLHAFDVGIMPLRMDREWDLYKCGTKLIQYMAVGTPGVASPVGVNAEIVRHGENGLLAATSEQWEEHLGRLVQDPELRRRLGEAARRRVEEAYSVQACLPHFIQTLSRAARKEYPTRRAPSDGAEGKGDSGAPS
jgi:glycosyltransferase involved in cell wall biosynthesis